MAQQKQNQAEKLRRHLSSSDHEMRRHLGSQSDWAKALVPQNGFNFDGSYNEEFD